MSPQLSVVWPAHCPHHFEFDEVCGPEAEDKVLIVQALGLLTGRAILPPWLKRAARR